MAQTPQGHRPTLSGRRYSRSGEQSRADELERIRRMTPLERVGLALALGRRRVALMALRARGTASGE